MISRKRSAWVAKNSVNPPHAMDGWSELATKSEGIRDHDIVANPDVLIAGNRIARLAGAGGEKAVGDGLDVMCTMLLDHFADCTQ